jgi:hypothetical protein
MPLITLRVKKNAMDIVDCHCHCHSHGHSHGSYSDKNKNTHPNFAAKEKKRKITTCWMNDIWGPPSLLLLLSLPPPSHCLLLPLLSSSQTLSSYAPSLLSQPLQLCAPPLPSPLSLSDCQGVCNGYLGMALHFAGESMLHTGHQLLQWVKEPNSGSKSFSSSILAKTGNISLPYYKIILDRSCNPEEGFIF